MREALSCNINDGRIRGSDSHRSSSEINKIAYFTGKSKYEHIRAFNARQLFISFCFGFASGERSRGRRHCGTIRIDDDILSVHTNTFFAYSLLRLRNFVVLSGKREINIWRFFLVISIVRASATNTTKIWNKIIFQMKLVVVIEEMRAVKELTWPIATHKFTFAIKMVITRSPCRLLCSLDVDVTVFSNFYVSSNWRRSFDMLAMCFECRMKIGKKVSVSGKDKNTNFASLTKCETKMRRAHFPHFPFYYNFD